MKRTHDKKDGPEFVRYIYWVDSKDFGSVRDQLSMEGFDVSSAKRSPCETLRVSGRRVFIASPEVWSRSCYRQGSWYRQSKKSGKYLFVSGQKLPSRFDRFLETEISESDFMPGRLPTRDELQTLVASECYQRNKPDEWEAVSKKDKILFRLIFLLTGFWTLRDNFEKHWLTHRANHANFLCKRFTTEIDGEDVPYSISENCGVCSACAELFNVVGEDSRKLVRGCPGSVFSGKLKRKIYYDVRPLRNKSRGVAEERSY
jgi:hypothetical protein